MMSADSRLSYSPSSLTTAGGRFAADWLNDESGSRPEISMK